MSGGGLTDAERYELQRAVAQSTSGSITGMLLTRAIEGIVAARVAAERERITAVADEWDASDEHGNPLREGSLGEAADELRAALTEQAPR